MGGLGSGLHTRGLTFHVAQNGCWIVDSHRPHSSGYIRLLRAGKIVRAHRLAYERGRGKIPKGLCVCHICDNRRCINPDHLFLGTKTENNRDRDRKGRTARGIHHGRWKHGKFANGSVAVSEEE